MAQDGDKLLSQLRNFSLIPQRCLTDCQSLGGDESKSWEYLRIVASQHEEIPGVVAGREDID